MGLLSVLEIVALSATTIATIVATIGVFLVREQLKLSQEQLELSRAQEVTQFEDELVREYREVIKMIPVKALLGEKLSEDEFDKVISSFYSYIDLSNTQVFYADEGRLNKDTWQNWKEGIISNFSRPAFREAWIRVDTDVRDNHGRNLPNSDMEDADFSRLRKLLKVELPEIPEDEQRDAIQDRKK